MTDSSWVLFNVLTCFFFTNSLFHGQVSKAQRTLVVAVDVENLLWVGFGGVFILLQGLPACFSTLYEFLNTKGKGII